uniref:zinc finger CCCH domain-containing protein 3-like n=1 Tax=Erigeron canadensis TaxID=72917 RepID=UPI001CB88B6A|nr:zinc finger CCCH domain-containing protein 3-like [Erigeron canadensis]
MSDNRSSEKNNGVSNSSWNPPDYNIEEGINRLRIQADRKEDDERDSTGYPDRPGQPDCVYYLRTGKCGYGDECRFNHPTYNEQDKQHESDHPRRVGEPDCIYFLKTGSCKYGSTCKYNHPQDRHGPSPVVLNMIGLPMRQGQKPCSHYLRTGSCKYGITCKFHHPQPPLDGSNTSPSQPLQYASSGAPPQIGAQWPYMSPQTYLPIVLPSSGTTQGWSAYMDNMSPLVSANGSSSMDHIYPSPSSHLPERPSEPECRYFINTGTCKYGSDCKYHHPREKMVQSPATSLSPFGFPLRPGQTVCSYYTLYGTCKYGSACKYDHPVVVYSYNYNMDLNSHPYFPSYGGMNSPILHSSESSPSKSSKSSGCTTEPTSNGKLCTDECSGEHVEFTHSSSHNQSD